MKAKVEIRDVGSFVNGVENGRPDLSRLILEIFPNANPEKMMNSHRVFPKYVALKHSMSGRRVVGFVFWRLTANEDGREYALVDHIGVEKGNRRLGIGTALMGYSLKDIHCNRNCCDVVIHCRKENDAKLFYDKLGFETVDLIEGYYANGDAAYEMVLKGDKKETRKSIIEASNLSSLEGSEA